MREIKFRGISIDSDSEGFVYGSLVKEVETGKESKWVNTQSYKGWSPAVHPYEKTTFYIIKPSDVEYLIEVNEKTIGQYTGLKDKNGVEIYEGDIFAYKTDRPVKVVFKNGSFQWSNGDNSSLIGNLDPDFIEVVGNIYEHPHLLKESLL